MNASQWFKGGDSSANGGESRKMGALRVLLIVVALHVIVLGPIMMFEGCKASTNEPKVTENTETPPPPPVEATFPTPEATATQNAAPLQSAAPVVTNIAPPAATNLGPAPVIVTPTETVKSVKVQSGDSLWKIAKAERVSVGDLMRANNLTEKSVLRIGQEVKIPAPTVAVKTSVEPTAHGVPADGANIYTVQAGDSLWVIARKFNTTVAALQKANNLTGNNIKVNQKLVIPAAAPKSSDVPMAIIQIDPIVGGTMREGEFTYHIVGVDEKLELIGKKYGVTTKEIRAANHLSETSVIRVNQRLVIPVKPNTLPANPSMPEAPKAPSATDAPPLG